jgi:hypothetical protein
VSIAGSGCLLEVPPYASIGTAPEDNPSALVAVSNGGTATGSGAAVSLAGGDANGGLLGIAVVGGVSTARGFVAMNPLGNAEGGYPVSGNGNASGANPISVTKDANGYGVFTVGGRNATGGIVTLAALGDATSNTAAVSVGGRAEGPTAVDGQGDARAAGIDVASNTGVDNDPADVALAGYVPEPGVMTSKTQEANQELSKLSALRGGISLQDFCDYTCGAQVSNQVVHAQETSYTCGPAAVRNALQPWVGQDFPEAQLRNELGTTSKGTVVTRIPRVLNNHESSDWMVASVPESPEYLYAKLARDVGRYNHGVIAHLLTDALDYYGRHHASHLVDLYGYHSNNSQPNATVDIADSNNAHYSNGARPLGFHAVPLNTAYGAIKSSESKLIIW